MRVHNQKQNSPNFTSNIRFIPNKGLIKILNNPKTQILGEMYTKNQLLEIKNQGGTLNVKYCLAGVFNLIKEGKDFLSHLMPRRFYEKPKASTHLYLKEIKDWLKNMPDEENLKTVLKSLTTTKFMFKANTFQTNFGI